MYASTMSCKHIGQPKPPEQITTHVTHYETDNILVVLNWTPENGVSYNIIITIIPRTAIAFNARMSIQLALGYNIQYNVSILATLCGQSDTTIAFYHVLNFGEYISDNYYYSWRVLIMCLL